MSRICAQVLRIDKNYHAAIKSYVLQNQRAALSRADAVTNGLSITKINRYSTKKSTTSLETYRNTGQVSADVRPLGEKVRETAKTTSYLGVILLGVGVTAAMFYTIFSELFSSKSPNNVYAKALDRCIADVRVKDMLGAPIKGYGEETRRGRRGHVSHYPYEKDGVKYLRMKFYIKGTRNKGTVHLEMMENSSGNYDYRYLFVQLDDYTQKTVMLENNTIQTKSNDSLQGFV